MNKKAQSLGLSIISIVFFLIIAFSSVNFIMDRVTDTTTQLNCDSSTLTGGSMFLCLITDVTVIYFILCIMSVIIGTIVARLLI